MPNVRAVTHVSLKLVIVMVTVLQWLLLNLLIVTKMLAVRTQVQLCQTTCQLKKQLHKCYWIYA